MKFTNVMVSVGRSPARAVASIPAGDNHDALCNAAEMQERASLTASGVSPERVKFDRVAMGAAEKATTEKKGKSK